MDLSNKKCVPCEVGGKPMTLSEATVFLQDMQGWQIKESKELEKRWSFKDFKEAINFVRRVADIAEGEGHHPDICVNYNKVTLGLSTHAVGGLTENDFILASKIEKIGL